MIESGQVYEWIGGGDLQGRRFELTKQNHDLANYWFYTGAPGSSINVEAYRSKGALKLVGGPGFEEPKAAVQVGQLYEDRDGNRYEVAAPEGELWAVLMGVACARSHGWNIAKLVRIGSWTLIAGPGYVMRDTCHERQREGDHSSYFCTMPKGHKSAHRAGLSSDNTKFMAEWPGKTEAPKMDASKPQFVVGQLWRYRGEQRCHAITKIAGRTVYADGNETETFDYVEGTARKPDSKWNCVGMVLPNGERVMVGERWRSEGGVFTCERMDKHALAMWLKRDDHPEPGFVCAGNWASWKVVRVDGEHEAIQAESQPKPKGDPNFRCPRCRAAGSL